LGQILTEAHSCFTRQVVKTVIEEPEKIPQQVDEEGYHVPAITQQQAQELRDAIKRNDEEKTKRVQDPKFQERGKYMKAWTVLGAFSASLQSLFCARADERLGAQKEGEASRQSIIQHFH